MFWNLFLDIVRLNHVDVWLAKLEFQYCAIDGFLMTDMLNIIEMNLFISSMVTLLHARGRACLVNGLFCMKFAAYLYE